MAKNASFYTGAEIAELFGVCRATVALWRKERRGPPFIQIGPKTYRYRKTVVDSYIAALERGEGPRPAVKLDQ